MTKKPNLQPMNTMPPLRGVYFSHATTLTGLGFGSFLQLNVLKVTALGACSAVVHHQQFMMIPNRARSCLYSLRGLQDGNVAVRSCCATEGYHSGCLIIWSVMQDLWAPDSDAETETLSDTV